MRNILLPLFAFLFVGLFSVPTSHAGFIFHKPAYHGKIIDHETKEPLEGVVVIVIYSTTDVIGGPGGPSSRDIGARETLTDENGFFTIPSYTAMVSPIARADGTKFIIFKPGYSSFKLSDKVFPSALCRNHEPYYFPPECNARHLFSKKIGSKQEVIVDRRTRKKITIINGIVELVKLKTWKERRKANVGTLSEFNLPIFKKIEKDEHKWIYSHRGWRLEK